MKVWCGQSIPEITNHISDAPWGFCASLYLILAMLFPCRHGQLASLIASFDFLGFRNEHDVWKNTLVTMETALVMLVMLLLLRRSNGGERRAKSEVRRWLGYCVRAPDDHGRQMITPTTSNIDKNEAVKPPKIVIKLRKARVIVNTGLRNFWSIQNIFLVSGLAVHGDSALGELVQPQQLLLLLQHHQHAFEAL